MTDDEKILEFGGFTAKQIYVQGTPDVEVTGPEGWDGKEPDTTDLTWLFKWCVPKLDNWSLNTYDTHVTAIVHRGTDMGTADAPKDRPGEALREAILALIKDGDALTSNGGMNDR